MRQIVADEIHSAVRYYFREIIMGVLVFIFVGSILWLALENKSNDVSPSYCPAEEPKPTVPSKKLSKEDIDKVMYVYEKVKDEQKEEKEKEKQNKYTPEKTGEVKGEDLDTYLARHSNCSDALVEEKVERILTRRAKVKEAEEV